MTKKKVKKIILITLSIILALLLLGVIISNAMSVKVIGKCAQYAEEYDEYYLYKKEIYLDSFFGFAIDSGYKIWVKPWQKRKLLEKIEEDVNEILTNIVADYSYRYKGYEISDDFKKISLYIYRDTIIPDDLKSMETIAPKVDLYHQLIKGYGNTELIGVMNIIEVEKE